MRSVVSTLCFGVVFSNLLIAPALGAVVPEGVTLAAEQKLIRGNGAEVTALDPHLVSGVTEANVLRELLEGLVITDPSGAKEIGGVAERWEHENLSVWTFYLRKNARWSNGDQVTAEDFVYSWKRLADPNTASPYASYLIDLKVKNAESILAGKCSPDTLGIQAVDQHTLRIELSEPLSYFIKMLPHDSLLPVHRKTVEAYQQQWTQPKHWVGNGAYRLKEWVVNEKLVLTRNPQYWDDVHTVINEVVFLPIASEVTELTRYRAGELDITNSLPVEHLASLRKTHVKEYRSTPELRVYYYECNHEEGPLKDARVRKALSLALDRELIVEKVKKQGDLPAYGMVPPYTACFFNEPVEWATWSSAKRIAEAKKLLAEAGYSDKNPLRFPLLYNTSDVHKKLALSVASLWKQHLGVEVALENKEWKSFLESRRTGQRVMARAEWTADYNDPSSFLGLFKSTSSLNHSRYKNPAYDRLLDQASSVSDEQERAKYYAQANALIMDDMVAIPVYFANAAILVKPYVGGYPKANLLRTVYTKDLYIVAH